MIKKVYVLILIAMFSSCSSHVNYVPTDALNYKQAADTVIELTAMQDLKFRPSYATLTDEFIAYNYDNTRVKVSRRTGRIYFKYIKALELQKYGNWYNVHILNDKNESFAEIYHSQDIGDTQLFMNAFNSLRKKSVQL